LETFAGNENVLTSESRCKSAFISNGSNITGAMQYADDNNLVVKRKIIDRVLFMEEHTQIMCEMGTGSAGEWKLQCLIESVCNAGEKVRGE
jgi:hypothetical protein